MNDIPDRLYLWIFTRFLEALYLDQEFLFRDVGHCWTTAITHDL